MSTAAFEPNMFYERLIAMRSTNRKAFDSMSPATRYALAQYEAVKREREQQETMKRGE
jgi:hypothetical protein